MLIYATNQCLPCHTFKEKPIHSNSHNLTYSAHTYQRAKLEKQHQRLTHSTSYSHRPRNPPHRNAIVKPTIHFCIHHRKLSLPNSPSRPRKLPTTNPLPKSLQIINPIFSNPFWTATAAIVDSTGTAAMVLVSVGSSWQQTGQEFRIKSQGSIQSKWYICLHGISRASDPNSNCSLILFYSLFDQWVLGILCGLFGFWDCLISGVDLLWFWSVGFIDGGWVILWLDDGGWVGCVRSVRERW